MCVCAPHQCHKAHPSADVPHLDGLVSGARQQEGAWFPALLALENEKSFIRHVHVSACVDGNGAKAV